MPANPLQSYNGSVIQDADRPYASGAGGETLSDYIIYVAGIGDTIPKWGTDPRGRDKALREFWITEPILAGAIFSTVSRYAGFEYDLTGPDRLVAQYERILHSSEHGRGWQDFMIPFLTDYFTTDNGAFAEIVRTDDAPTAPVIQLNHLDSNQCRRTGNAEYPVIYWDKDSNAHRLAWYQVAMFTEMPSPIERHHGRQYCAVTRVLQASQTRRDIETYKRERANGNDTKQIHVVSGVSTQKIDAAIGEARNTSQAQGYARYTRAVVVGSLSPDARAQVATIDLASLNDGYDSEKALKEYITIVAMCLGIDFQELAPLPTGSMGSGTQSEVLALKARGKGPNLFMRGLEFLFNYHGILPQNLTFSFGEQDTAQDLDNAKLRLMRAEERAMRIKSGEISPDAARALAVEAGDLTQELADTLKDYQAPEVQAKVDAALKPKVDNQEGGRPATSITTQ